tara:strand:+ start:32 stop:535 length:504 start_codon:yes stop_codon:yes gene_type:complete
MALIVAGTTLSATTQAKGSWTPASGGSGGGTLQAVDARYNRVGNMVHWFCWVKWTVTPNNTSGSAWYLTGLPITSADEGNTYAGFAMLIARSHTNCQGVIPKNSSYVRWARQPDGRTLTVASNTGTQFEGTHAYATAGSSGGAGYTIPDLNADSYATNMYITGYYSV